MNGTGLYTITSAVTGKFYIGSTLASFKKRWNEHKYQLRKGKHSNPHLQRAWNKDGEDNMIFAIYLKCEKHECRELEQLAIDLMIPEYNIAKNVELSFLGCNHTDETKKKISIANTGRIPPPMSEANREALRIINTGRTHTNETKAKISQLKTGTKLSPEHCAAISLSLTGRSKTPETLAKMSESAKNRDPEWGRKLSARQMGADNPMYGRTGDKSPRFGVKNSPEVCANLSALAKSRTGENSQRGRPVCCVELNKEFPTARLAMSWLREQGLTTARDGHINDVCRGKRPLAHGFTWKYVDPDKK